MVISSASGIVGIPMRTAYCASKFAVTGFFEALRIELSEINYKIDITLICPPSVSKFSESQEFSFNIKVASNKWGFIEFYEYGLISSLIRGKKFLS